MMTLRYRLLCVAILGLGSCDKVLPRENVTPLPGTTGSGAGSGEKPSAGDSFMPSARDGGQEGNPQADAGSGDGGAQEPTCGGGPSPTEVFSKRALLESVASCTLLQYCKAQELAQAFATAAEAYAKEPTDTTQRAVKDAWYFALQRWQVAELFRFGPAAPAMEPGGMSLRDQIYAFPAVSRCTIEEQIIAQGYASGAFANIPFNARGFGAAEYLLFYGGSSNACSAFSSLNYPAPGKWAALSVLELASRKQAYVAAVASDLSRRTLLLSEAWQADRGNFARELATAGHGSSIFATEQAGLNAVSHALFYIDKEVKDWKVARPAGLMECSTDCATYAESPYARVGADNIRANLAGFRLLFQGCAEDHRGLGFDDWLRAVGMEALADDMLVALDGAEAAVKGFPLDQRLVEDPSSVVPVHQAIKRLTDLLKVDFVSALDLEIPMTLEGDND